MRFPGKMSSDFTGTEALQQLTFPLAELWPKYQSMCWSITFVNCSNHNNYCERGSLNVSRKCCVQVWIVLQLFLKGNLLGSYRTKRNKNKIYSKRKHDSETWHVYTFTLTTEGCGETCFWTVEMCSAFVAGLVSRTFVLTTFRSRVFVET